MKKILNWFKKLTLLKSSMILSVIASTLYFSVGETLVGVSHAVIALLLLDILLIKERMEEMGNILEAYEKTNIGYFEDVISQIKEKKYWISRYLLEKLKLDFCKRKISLSEFLDELPKMENIVYKNHRDMVRDDKNIPSGVID